MEDSDTKFSEAPPLPRYPTVIAGSMPRPPTGDEFEDDPTVAPFEPVVTDGSPTHLVAPPRFPSLVDVDVTKASAAASAQPSSTADIDGVLSHSTIAAPSSGFPDDDPDLLVSTPPPGEPIGRQLEQEILETIKRDKVEPGTGARRASAAASEQWTSMDQRQLNALLRDASGQLPSPDMTRKGSIDQLPRVVSTSIAARVAALNEAVSEDDKIPRPDDSNLATQKNGFGTAAILATAPADVNLDREISPDDVEPGDTLVETFAQMSTDEKTSPERPIKTLYGVVHPGDDVPVLGSPPMRSVADRPPIKGRAVSSAPSAFPSALATVPMTVFSGPGTEAQVEETAPAEPDIATKHEAMVQSKSTNARVNITGDFGLKYGHEGVVRDSAFFDNDTLLTAGEDGKVCIWDLEEKFVKSLFLPYNGNPVQMIKPIVEENGSSTRSLITLSDDRLMRIWNLIDNQAVLLRSMQIPDSSRDLVMSIPVLTPQMKAHAAAAAAAAQVMPTDLTESAPPSLDLNALQAQSQAAARQREVGVRNSPPVVETEGTTEDTVEEVKNFPFQGKLFSKGRKASSKKAVAL